MQLRDFLFSVGFGEVVLPSAPITCGVRIYIVGGEDGAFGFRDLTDPPLSAVDMDEAILLELRSRPLLERSVENPVGVLVPLHRKGDDHGESCPVPRGSCR